MAGPNLIAIGTPKLWEKRTRSGICTCSEDTTEHTGVPHQVPGGTGIQLWQVPPGTKYSAGKFTKPVGKRSRKSNGKNYGL